MVNCVKCFLKVNQDHEVKKLDDSLWGCLLNLACLQSSGNSDCWIETLHKSVMVHLEQLHHL